MGEDQMSGSEEPQKVEQTTDSDKDEQDVQDGAERRAYGRRQNGSQQRNQPIAKAEHKRENDKRYKYRE
jgi:hypothetical protein